MATVSVKTSVVHDQKSLSTFLEGLSITSSTCTYRTTHISYTTCTLPAKWSLWLCPILGSKIVLKLLQNEWLKWPSTLECRATFLKHTTVHIFFCAKLSRYFLPERKKTRSFWIGNRVLVSLTVLLMTRKQPTKVLLTGYDILSEKFRANNNNK